MGLHQRQGASLDQRLEVSVMGLDLGVEVELTASEGAQAGLAEAVGDEPCWDCRRLYLLRGWSHDEEGIDEIRT
jgi:hypothetical protein